MPNDGIILFPDDPDWGSLPDDFLEPDVSDETINTIKDIRRVVGASLRPLITDMSGLQEQGKVSNLRGIRFASGADALIWLFRRGIFLFSRVVNLGDGTWGVSIWDSNQVQVDQGEDDDENGDLVF